MSIFDRFHKKTESNGLIVKPKEMVNLYGDYSNYVGLLNAIISDHTCYLKRFGEKLEVLKLITSSFDPLFIDADPKSKTFCCPMVEKYPDFGEPYYELAGIYDVDYSYKNGIKKIIDSWDSYIFKDLSCSNRKYNIQWDNLLKKLLNLPLKDIKISHLIDEPGKSKSYDIDFMYNDKKYTVWIQNKGCAYGRLCQLNDEFVDRNYQFAPSKEAMKKLNRLEAELMINTYPNQSIKGDDQIMNEIYGD